MYTTSKHRIPTRIVFGAETVAHIVKPATRRCSVTTAERFHACAECNPSDCSVDPGAPCMVAVTGRGNLFVEEISEILSETALHPTRYSYGLVQFDRAVQGALAR